MATYSGTPATWTAGQTVTASDLNAEVRDPLAALAGAWNSYTPTLSQGASSDITKTVSYAKYIRVGKLVIASGSLSITAAGTSASAVRATLPVPAAAAGLKIGVGYYFDTGSTGYRCIANLGSTTTVELWAGDASGTGAGVGAQPAFAAASGDTFQFTVVYEAA